jgi:hypothetical protein
MSPGTGAAWRLNTLLRNLLWIKSFVKGGGAVFGIRLKTEANHGNSRRAAEKQNFGSKPFC